MLDVLRAEKNWIVPVVGVETVLLPYYFGE